MAQPGNPPITKDIPPQISILSAKYSSPTNIPFTNTQTLPAPSTTIASKTAYLSSLRSAIGTLQETVNKELTARMEEDKAREEGGSGKIVDEKKEEDNYGEEMVEED